METTGMTELTCYAVSIIACAALAFYFLREYLDKRVRAFLWWATGFSLFAFGILTTAVGAFYRFHTILAMFTFAFIAASMAFLYYAASLHFLDRKSFFREKFTVILFVVSFVLLLLLLYFLSEEYINRIIESPTIVLFVVVFLVLAVLFNQFIERLFKKYYCERIRALQSLAWWIVTVGILCVALFYGSVIAVGFVFVLSVCGFVLLLYGCRGGVNMKVGFFEEDKELSIQRINGVEDKIKRQINSIQVRLNDAMQKIGDALLHTMTLKEPMILEDLKEPMILKDKKPRFLLQENVEKRDKVTLAAFMEERTKNKMVARASTIGMKEDELVVRVVELAETILGLARSVYESNPSQFDGGNEARPESAENDRVPLDLECGEMGEHVASQGGAASKKIERLATLAFFKSSTDRDLIKTCCELVKVACDVENFAVTEYKWEELPVEEHPGGVIGHTYSILRYYDEKTEKKDQETGEIKYKYSTEFKGQFWDDADELLNEAENLRNNADDFMNGLPEPPETPGSGEAEQATTYLGDAIELLQDASDLVFRASKFVSGLLPRS